MRGQCRRKPTGNGGKGTAKKKSREFATFCDIFRHFPTLAKGQKALKKSGQVRPQQGTEICNFGAPSPLEALRWIFCLFSIIYVQLSKTSPLKSGEVAKNPVEKISETAIQSQQSSLGDKRVVS